VLVLSDWAWPWFDDWACASFFLDGFL
jgi:hypothetical protein